ncbi:unnamed protein product, partial [marine sediment metagenome]
ILTHSFKGDKDYDQFIKNFSFTLAENGYTAYRFDCFGSGESEGDFIDATVTSEIEDLEDIIKYVREQNHEAICLVGLSLGGIVSILAYDNSIKCLILWGPPLDLSILYKRYKSQFADREYLEQTQKYSGKKIIVGRKMWEEFNEYQVPDKLPEITSPVLVIYGENDELTDVYKKGEIFNKFNTDKKELMVIKNGDHDFLIPEAQKEASDLSINWIKKYL